jgi:Domain of unknown function (DUF1844)
MPEDPKNPSNFKVVDRRTFSEDGSVRDRPSEDDKREAVEIPGGRQASPSSAPAATNRRGPELEDSSGEGDQGFETLISYLSTTAMFQLGLLPGPSGERIPTDLENARRTIDMLEVLQHKTRGNLTGEEAKLLEEVLYELRMGFVEVERRRAQKAK